jgi:hypothetical protein
VERGNTWRRKPPLPAPAVGKYTGTTFFPVVPANRRMNSDPGMPAAQAKALPLPPEFWQHGGSTDKEPP